MICKTTGEPSCAANLRSASQSFLPAVRSVTEKVVASTFHWATVKLPSANTDQNEAYGKAICALKSADALEKSVQHRQVKYLNNRLEADHGALKRLINPTRGFKTLPTASATIKGFEVMRMIRKRQCLMLESGAAGELRFVNRLFRLAA